MIDASPASAEDLSTPLGVENVAMVHGDRAAATAAFERLGFRMSPEGRYALGTDEPRFPLGLCSRHAFLPRGGYWEVVTIEQPDRNNLGYDALLARGGNHLTKITLRLEDPIQELARLRALDVEAAGPVDIRRQLVRPNGASVDVDMQLLVYPERWTAAWLHSSLIHRDRDCNYLPELLDHENGVQAIEGVIVSTRDPEATLARLAQFAGCVPEPATPTRIQFADGTWIEVEHESDSAVAGTESVESIRSVVFSVASMSGIAGLFESRNVDFDWDATRSRILVGPDEAAGASMAFEAWTRDPTAQR